MMLIFLLLGSARNCSKVGGGKKKICLDSGLWDGLKQ